jgi:hypothetical protein
MVRAKFRCLEISYRLNQTLVKLKPVIAKNDDWPNGSEENAKFWSASPHGEIEFSYDEGVGHPFKLRGYYYLDMEPGDESEERPWKLWSLEQSESTLTIKMGMSYDNEATLRSASLMLSIENVDAWPHFQGTIGTPWKVSMTEAGGDHTGCPYTG